MELLIFLWLVQGVVVGMLCSWVANQKGRSGISWFFLGFLFSILALLALIAIPNIESKQNPSHSNAVFTKYSGERDITIDKYKLYLTRKYRLEKNEILSAFVFQEKIFTTLDEALFFLHKKDESTHNNNQLSQEKGKEAANLANQVRDVRKGVVISTLIIIILVLFLVANSNKEKDSKDSKPIDFPNGTVKEGGYCTKTSDCWLYGSHCEKNICTTLITPKGGT